MKESVRWIFGAIICVAVLAWIGANLHPSSIDTAVATPEVSTALAAKQIPAPPKSWDYFNSKDGMTDQVIYHAAIQSTNTVNLEPPYTGEQHGTLVLRVKASGAADVIFYIERGQLLCHDSVDNDQCPVSLRTDAADVYTVNASPPNDGSSKSIFLPDEKAFISKLSRTSRLRIQVGIYRNGNQVFDFDVAGLDVKKLGLPVAKPAS